MPFVITSPAGGSNGAAMAGLGQAAAYGGSPLDAISRGINSFAAGLGGSMDKIQNHKLERDDFKDEHEYLTQQRIKNNRAFYARIQEQDPEAAADPFVLGAVETGGDVGQALWHREMGKIRRQAETDAADKAAAADATKRRGQDMNYDLGASKVGVQQQRVDDQTTYHGGLIDLGNRRADTGQQRADQQGEYQQNMVGIKGRGLDISQQRADQGYELGQGRLDQGLVNTKQRGEQFDRRQGETERHDKAMEGRPGGKAPPTEEDAAVSEARSYRDVSLKEYGAAQRGFSAASGSGDSSQLKRAQQYLDSAHKKYVQAELRYGQTDAAAKRSHMAKPAATAGPAQISTAREHDALPPGTEYIDPSGVRRTKQ